MKVTCLVLRVSVLLPLIFAACKEKRATPSKEIIESINLKRGEIVTCGPPDQHFGTVNFETSCGDSVKEDFNLAVKLLHSFEYDEAEKVFAKVIDNEPACAMAYWGVAMSNFHPLWNPPTEAELKKGTAAINIAQSITQASAREKDYINAISIFYKDWNAVDHRTRCLNFEKAMENLYTKYPADIEPAIFYALALNAAADPADKSFAKQKKAASILNALYDKHPDHPGIVHYIIHTNDYPELASLALPAARRYASVAPSSAHALHMPSHIFTRLGLWNEDISSNLASVASAQCYAQSAGIKGHWDEEMHGLDYLVYSYLQKGENDSAKKQLDYMESISEVNPANFKVAYSFAAMPARYALENKNWKEAAALQAHHANFEWKNFPWQLSIINFTRLMGAVHLNNVNAAKKELAELNRNREALLQQKDAYKANQVDIQIKMGEAWIRLKEKKNDEAIKLMKLAAEMEDKTTKHPVTPGEVLPARELLGDMYLQLNKPDSALYAYEADLKKQPNRFNGLYGAGLAAEKMGDTEKAAGYYRQLLGVVDTSASNRPELNTIDLFLRRH